MGVLIGYAIRSTAPLPFELHPIVWKQINRTKLTEEDLKTSDLHSFNYLESLMTVDKQRFEKEFNDRNFTIELSGGS